MAKSKIAKKLRKAIVSPSGLRASMIIGGTAVGGISGFSRSEPGLRSAGAKEGAIGGALLGSGLAFSPQIARFAGRTIKSEAKRAGRTLKRKARVRSRKIKGFFRRGGRTIPIYDKG